MLALDRLAHELVVDPAPAMAHHLVAGLDDGPRGFRVPFQRHRNGEEADRDSTLGEDAREYTSAGSVHGVDEELEAGGGDLLEIREFLDGFDVRLLEVCITNRACLRSLWDRLIEFSLNGLHNCRASRSTITRLVLHSIPVERIMTRRNHHPTSCAEVLYAE